jgi:DNA-binding NarL/FixJ family response regulator
MGKPEPRKAKVLVVDDHPIVRQGMAQLIGHEPDLTVCAGADNAADALKAIAAEAPDVVVVDLSLKGTSGLDLIKDIKIRFPKLPVLVLSMYDEAIYAERALRAGARGYMMKEEAIDKVLPALRTVLGGDIYLSQAMASRLLHVFVGGRPDGGASPAEVLSDRELEVFRLIGKGLGNAEIAQHLHISPKTVETYRAHLKNKLHLSSAGELLQYAIEWSRGLGD